MAYEWTPWGYEVDGETADLVSEDEFDSFTGGRWAGDPRVPDAIAAASAAVRAACGWHVCPSLPCRATIDADGRRSLWLPAMMVTGVTSIAYSDGTVPGRVEWSRIGQVTASPRPPAGLRSVEVEYEAGFSAVPADVRAVVCGLVVRSVALDYGVTSETVGGVSYGYAAAAAGGGAGIAALSDADMAALRPFRVVSAHAS